MAAYDRGAALARSRTEDSDIDILDAQWRKVSGPWIRAARAQGLPESAIQNDRWFFYAVTSELLTLIARMAREEAKNQLSPKPFSERLTLRLHSLMVATTKECAIIGLLRERPRSPIGRNSSWLWWWLGAITVVGLLVAGALAWRY